MLVNRNTIAINAKALLILFAVHEIENPVRESNGRPFCGVDAKRLRTDEETKDIDIARITVFSEFDILDKAAVDKLNTVCITCGTKHSPVFQKSE